MNFKITSFSHHAQILKTFAKVICYFKIILCLNYLNLFAAVFIDLNNFVVGKSKFFKDFLLNIL